MKLILKIILDFLANLLRSLFAKLSKYNPNTNIESMNYQIYKNIDVVQINIKSGVSEYFLPQNVDWADEVIEKISIYTSNLPEDKQLSPFDGISEILSHEEIPNSYLDIFNQDGVEIAHNLSAQSIVYTNNHPIELNSKISLTMSRIVYSQAPSQDGCILLYIYHGSKCIDTDDRPARSVTVNFSVGDGEDVMLSEVIDTYIHSQGKKLKGISFWGEFNDWNSAFITLRDYNYTKPILNSVPLAFCRPMMSVDPSIALTPKWTAAQCVQVQPMYLDNADIDFDNSFIHNSNGRGEQNITLTFLY